MVLKKAIKPYLVISILLVIAGQFCLVTGCRQEKIETSDIVARVNDQVLTSAEVASWEAALSQVTVPKEVRSSFIRNWVIETLLYQEALTRNLDQDPWILERLDNVERKLLVSRVLDLNAIRLEQPTPSEIKIYYQEHAAEFVWENIHLEVKFWHSETSDGMERLRGSLLRETPNPIWTGKPDGLEEGTIYLNGETQTDPKVWQAVSKLKVGQFSKVLPINNSSWIFKLLDRRQKGDPKTIAEVESEIAAILFEKARESSKEELIQRIIAEYRQSGRLYWADAHSTISVVDTLQNK